MTMNWGCHPPERKIASYLCGGRSCRRHATPRCWRQEGHNVDGRDLCVEGIGVFEIVVPDLINDIVKKFGNATLGCFVTGIVIEAGFVGRLCTNLDASSAMLLS